MVTFLHTADWQMGMMAGHTGEAAEKVRRARLDAARAVVAAARERDADFMVLCGDLFESNGVEGVLVQRTADILDGFGKAVYIIPGNHDPLAPGSVWEHPAWRSSGRLHALDRAEPVDAGGAVLFPCPLEEKHSAADPTAWIKARGEERICIGLAHGTVEGVPLEEPDYPVPRGAAAARGLDYLALGHWHSAATYEDSSGAVRMAYSGTHEATRFGERESGGVFVVEIAGRGAAPRLERVSTGGLRWEKRQKTLRAPGVLKDLLREVEALEDPDRTLLWLVLEGVLFARETDVLARLREVLAARFLFHRIDDEGLVPAPGDDEWIESLPAGYLREAARRLREAAKPAGRGVDEETAARARLALVELYAISREVKP